MFSGHTWHMFHVPRSLPFLSFLLGVVGGAVSNVHEWSLKEIPFAHISEHAQDVQHALVHDGLLLLTDITDLEQEFAGAIHVIDTCKARTMAGVISKGDFEDMVVRQPRGDDKPTTTRESKVTSCDTPVSPVFRRMIHDAGVAVAQAFGPRGEKFVREGMHKEMFHRYANVEANELSWHKDAGVFLAMTSRHDDPKIPYELKVMDPWGFPADITIPSNAILIVGGEAFGKSVELLGSPIRSVEHAAIENVSPTSVRYWFGQMFLPSENFEIDTESGPVAIRDWLKQKNAANIGCISNVDEYSTTVIRDLRGLSDAEQTCDLENERYCWMQCINTTRQKCVKKNDHADICPEEGTHGNRECIVEDLGPDDSSSDGGMSSTANPYLVVFSIFFGDLAVA